MDESNVITPQEAERIEAPPQQDFEGARQDQANAELEQIKAREKKQPAVITLIDYRKFTGRQLPEGVRPFMPTTQTGKEVKRAAVETVPTLIAGMKQARKMNDEWERREQERAQEQRDKARKAGAR